VSGVRAEDLQINSELFQNRELLVFNATSKLDTGELERMSVTDSKFCEQKLGKNITELREFLEICS